MSDIQIFDCAQFGQVRTIQRDGAPWFVAADVCRVLEVDRTASRRLDDDEKDVYSTHTPGGDQEMTIVNESGLYALVLGSRKPEAKAFKRWVTHEVIPAIRKHGAYATDETIDRIIGDPDFGIRLLGELKQEREQRKALEAKNEQMQPKARFADAVSSSRSSILVGELAKLLTQNGIATGQNRLFNELRKRGYLVKRRGSDYNMPTQWSMENGWFEIKESVINHSDGHTSVTRTSKVTGKGQVYFINLFMEEKALQ